ncbi:RecQ family ATP-dependent DNA helicase [Bacteroidota bacterium]
MDKEQAEILLRTAIGDPNGSFRDGQWEAIDRLVNDRKKLLVVQRTGWGKSVVYFLATRILRDRGAGLTLIVSPLLALVRNQIEAAKRLGIRATTVNSTNVEDWGAIHARVLNDEIDVLLISPQRLSNEKFLDRLLLPIAGRIGLFVVDEAHCISDWGHAFVPDYRRIANVLRQMPPNMPILGTTATANNRVITDVVSQLGDVEVVRGPLGRESLALQTLVLSDQPERLAWLAKTVPQLDGAGIIYVLTKRDALQVSSWLQKCGVDARPYFSDVKHEDFEDSNAYRLHLEDALLANNLKALVATTALGMGYDKPDLGFVIHYQAPGSIVGYYQQVGRAGRGIDHAFGIMLSGREDDDIHEFFRRSAFPTEAQIREILDVLEQEDGLSLTQIERHANLKKSQIEKVLKFLNVENPAPVIKDGSTWRRTPVPFQLDKERIEHLTRQREIEWAEVVEYIGATSCQMAFLRDSLDDPTVAQCGKCENCVGRPLLDPEVDEALVIQATQYLRTSEMPLQARKQFVKDAFVEYGFRGNIAPELQAEEGRILSRWGDAGWGSMVADDKHTGAFRDALVVAAAGMIKDRWHLETQPEWVTCVPSSRHPLLVPDFAARLAAQLRLPFIQVITKTRTNEQQKFQENSYHRCKNLDGVFEVNPGIPSGPVLLVDDIVDSRWTMTVLAALLRQAGSGPVFAFALATTSTAD